jgi:hypothetical protein
VIRRRAPIKRTRLKRSQTSAERMEAALPKRARVVEAAWKRDGGQCQAKHLVEDVRCGGPLDPHEIIPRSAWRAGVHELDNVLIVCRAHHRWIDNHPHAAHELGLHKFSWERP